MADLGFPINFEGPLTEGQLELWSEEYRLDSERRAEEARIAETEARDVEIRKLLRVLAVMVEELKR